MRLLGSLALFCAWRSSVLLQVGGRRCCCRSEVAGAVAGVVGSVLWWASLCSVASRWPAGAVHGHGDIEKYVQKLSEARATQSAQTTFDGSTPSTPIDENKRQKIELDSQKKVLDDVQAKLILEQAKSKKQTKKVQKYAKATQDIQAQMFQWHSVMKNIIPNLPPPIPVIDSLSESEDDGEDDNDNDDGGGGGADE
ncbi:hypothetical protein Cgig2_008266 [Carnegiea gigantea]|uniref:Uncharacterized protein n=1 Tax=Carnegiea gigantea TaxID=171969 RepID=A0A9Q1L0R3_9CARY|nr:hypothetical protein Cgig2_008266 [Carnegiea gigantea]